MEKKGPRRPGLFTADPGGWWTARRTRSGGLLGDLAGRWKHFFQRYGSARQSADFTHENRGNTALAPLRNGRGRPVKVSRKPCNAPTLSIEPITEGHGMSLAEPKPDGQEEPKPVGLASRMATETRRANFRLVMKRRYENSQQKIAAVLGITKGRVSQLLDENEAFGEKVARSIEEKLGLPDGSLEAPIPGDDELPSGLSADLAKRLAKMAQQLPPRKIHALLFMAECLLPSEPAADQDAAPVVTGESMRGLPVPKPKKQPPEDRSSPDALDPPSPGGGSAA